MPYNEDVATSILNWAGRTFVRSRRKRRPRLRPPRARRATHFSPSAAKRHRCHTIFLAHHADDLVETFLFNLIRGAGLTGLAGMRNVSTRRIDGVDLTTVRPLLSVWRSDIDKYVHERQLRFREDATNKTLAATRNRIRNCIIPYLEKIRWP